MSLMPIGQVNCFFCAPFGLGLLQIILIDLVLSIDNAIIISLATRDLANERRRYVMATGIILAIFLRILFTLTASYLLTLPYLRIIGGLILFIIALQLLKPKNAHPELLHDKTPRAFMSSLATILIADVIMSLDNALAIAGIANDHLVLLILGLILSIPLIMMSSELLNRLLDQFPAIIYIGAGILGHTAAKMIISDHIITKNLPIDPRTVYMVPVLSFFITIGIGYLMRQVLQHSTHDHHTSSM